MRLLSEHGIRPSRALGQNFVADPNTVERIVRIAGVAPGANAVEIGAGLGSLTFALAAAGASVVAIELDRRLAQVLRETTEGLDVTVVQADAMAVDWNAIVPGPEPSVMVANLPYNIATPVLLRLLEEAPAVERFTLMVQREVGERWVAGRRDEAFGAVSVKVAWWAAARLAGAVPRGVFVPQPRVDSVLVSLERRDPPTGVDRKSVFALIEAGFATRRKMLRRTLAGLVDQVAFDAAGVAPTDRAEDLNLEDWVRLAAAAAR
ncbi:MAG TPA: 16S rRNA (adenine(1518)-N(6)/adenine(1519)-N(6))-dimethyltransferase RsmA [Acidimicrobiales bacterium]|nr:16S rRNA (adenine(1518)-N(6)/adenine(1519)-N(6))-dimethyltransferase RsmA [Acidimicrobiales bacterium]